MQQERATDAAVVAEDDVLGDGNWLDEAEVLMHHRDACVDRVARRVELHGLAEELDRPSSGR